MIGFRQWKAGAWDFFMAWPHVGRSYGYDASNSGIASPTVRIAARMQPMEALDRHKKRDKKLLCMTENQSIISCAS
jgi:hypothetical protein